MSIPSNGKLMTEQRRRRILEIVEADGIVSADKLIAELGISPMTLWRDLSWLDQAGKVRRVRGGVVRLDETIGNEPRYKAKQVLNIEKKKAIARYAVERFVEDNDIIILEAGTTVGTMVKYFNRQNLTVITNGLGTLNDLTLCCVPDVTVLSCGGLLRDVAYTFVGPQAEEFFRNVHAHTLFLSCSGLAFPEGITDPNLLEIQIKRAMADSAGRIVLLIDSTKFGRRSLSPIIPLDKIQVLITDQEAPEQDLAQIREMGIEVYVAE